MKYFNFLDRLENLKCVGNDRWRARCPSHQGRSQSLSIKATPDALLIKCHAGCSALNIVQSVGLRLADLFDNSIDQTPAIARAHRLQRDARATLEAIQTPIIVLMLGCDLIATGKQLSNAEYDEVNQSFRLIHQALDGVGIQSTVIDSIDQRVRGES